jgi:hypothetical protein
LFILEYPCYETGSQPSIGPSHFSGFIVEKQKRAIFQVPFAFASRTIHGWIRDFLDHGPQWCLQMSLTQCPLWRNNIQLDNLELDRNLMFAKKVPYAYLISDVPTKEGIF